MSYKNNNPEGPPEMSTTQNTAAELDFDMAEIAAVAPTAQDDTIAATDKQRAFATSLGQELAALESEMERINGTGTATMTSLREMWAPAMADRQKASDLIEAMLHVKRSWKETLREETARTAQAARPAAPEGMHKVGEEIFKVQIAVNGSGRPYAKKLVQDGESWGFEYAPGAMRKLSEGTLMTLEQAKEFGALYGTCCSCGRTLTNEASIAAGIGPVCGKVWG